MDLYDRIRALCDEYEISFRTLEKDVGIGHGSVNRWHDQMPRASTLQKVADYLGVSVNYLLGNEESSEYNYDVEISRIAQLIVERSELNALFEASKEMSKEAIENLIKFINSNKY